MLLDMRHPFGKLGDRHGRYVGDTLAADLELQSLALQARAVAERTLAIDDELLAPLLSALRVFVGIALDPLRDALPRQKLVARRGTVLRSIYRKRFAVAVEDSADALLGDRAHGVVEREAVTPPQRIEHGEKDVVAVLAQRLDTAVAQRARRIGHDLLDIEHRLLAQTVALRAGSLRRVERKGVGCRILEGIARGRAHQMPRIVARALALVIVENHRALALPHRLGKRTHDAFAVLLAHRHAIDDHIDRMHLVAVEFQSAGKFADLAVDAGIYVTLLGHRLEQLAVVSLAPLDHGRHESHATRGETFDYKVAYLLVGKVLHLLARGGRVGARGARIEQAQKVVDLGHGAHRRTRVLVGGLLLYGHHGAKPRYLVDIGALHSPDELPRVGRQRLHIASLPLGIDRVESQRRFARTRKAGYHDQLVARYFEIDVFEVVHPRAENPYLIFTHCIIVICRRGGVISWR